MSLDFSKMRTAAYGLWSHSNRLFALSSSNAILEFLLDVSTLKWKQTPLSIFRENIVIVWFVDKAIGFLSAYQLDSD